MLICGILIVYRKISEGRKMARLIRPTWAIRCVQSGCRTLFEVAQLEEGKQQEVVCPNCGEHYVYPIIEEKENA